jgi:hypothetical protein
MDLPQEECVFINGISHFSAGREAFRCVHPNKAVLHLTTAMRTVKMLGKHGVSATGNALGL